MKLECWICKKEVEIEVDEMPHYFVCGKCYEWHFLNRNDTTTLNISTSQNPPIILKGGELSTGRIEF